MTTIRSFGTIRKPPSGRYQARYWHLGKQVSADTTFSNKTDARAFLAGIETDLKRGTFVDPVAGRVTFAEYAGWWLDQRPVRQRTRETYESQLNRLLPTFATHELSSITPAEVRTWHGRLSKSGLSWNTVAKCYRLFRTIMTTAVDDGLLLNNPVRFKGASAERIVERPLLMWPDVAALADAINPRFDALVWAAAGSGLRFGELTGLAMDHVDLDRCELRASRALSVQRGHSPALGPPKTESAHRTVEIPRSIAARIEQHIQDFEVPGERDALVFTSLRGGPLLNTYFAPRWQQARSEVGLEHVRFHDLRHFAGTEAATAGASLREVMARMGHSSSAASLRYLKAAEGRGREIADAIELRINGTTIHPITEGQTLRS
jgi:integrase